MVSLLAAVVACEEPKEIGLTPTTPVGVLYTDTLTITRTTIQFDSVRSQNQSSLLVGRYTDPQFGQVEAKAYVNGRFINDFTVLDTLTSAVTSADRILYDSTRLVLDLSGSWYGDTTNQQEIQISQLRDTIRTQANYDISSTISSNSIPLVRQVIRPRPTARDSINARFALPDDYGKKILALANTDAGKLVNPALLKAQFNPGLLISSTGSAPAAILGYQPGVVGQGGIYGSYTVVYYHVKGEVSRRAQYLLLSGERFNQIMSKRNGVLASLTPGQSLPTTITGRTYIQPATGITTKLQFPTFSNLIKSGRIAINRADLVITPVPTEDAKLPLPPFMLLSEVNAQNRLTRTDITSGGTYLFTVQLASAGPLNRLGSSYVSPQTAFLDTRTNSYTFNMGGYLQSVVSGISPNNGLAVLTPSNLLFQSTQAGTIDATQSVLTDRVWRMTLEGKASVKLIVFYTTSN
jgi:Domain of unknown function (DUF4270)